MRFRALIGLGLSAAVATAAYGASSWFQGGSVPEALANAHAAFLAQDYAAALTGIKKVYESYPQDELLQKNALELYKSVVLAGGETARPEGTSLPEELSSLEVIVGRRRLPDAVDYSLKVSGHALPTHDAIKQVSLTSYTGEVVLDREKNIGEWDIDPAPGEEGYFEIGNFDLRTPPKEGLYYIHAEFSDGASWDGWVILSGLLASESPDVVEPAQGQVFATATPTVVWHDFRSPEYRAAESRSIWVAVAKANPYRDVFSFWQANPSIERWTIPENHALENGPYLATVAYLEKRSFGAIKLGRSSATVRRFKVDVQ